MQEGTENKDVSIFDINEQKVVPSAAEEVVCPISKKKKILCAVFNMAVGAGLTALTKTAIVGAMITCPPMAVLLATSVATGLVMTALCHEGKRRAAKKATGNAPAFFSKKNAKSFFNKQNAKVFATSGLFSFIGGALFLGFQTGVIQDGLQKIFGSTPAPAAVLPVPVDIPAPCPSTMENFASVIKDHPVSDRVQDALQRADSANPHVAAQGAKDLGYFAFNGLDGVPKDATVALELFQKAADGGNAQAKIDLLYAQFHGLGGVQANQQAAFDAMRQIRSPRADWFVQQWTEHAGKTAGDAAQAFDSKSILQGVKFCAPA